MNKSYHRGFFLALFLYCTATGDTATFHRYLWANYNHFSGNVNIAQDWYKPLLDSQCSVFTNKGYLSILFDSRQYGKIIELMPSLDKKFEKDPEVQLLFASALEKTNQIDQADNRIILLSKTFKTHSEIILKTTQAYLRRKEPENALLAIDAYLNNTPKKANNFLLYFLKSQINIQLNQLPEALANVTQCLDMHPRFSKGWLLMATLQEQQGELKKAMQGYTTFLSLSEASAIENHLFALLLKNKSNREYDSFHRTYFDQALSLFHKKQYTLSFKCLSGYLQLQPDDYQALVLKLQLLAVLKKHKEIVSFIGEISIQKKYDAHVWAKNIHLLHQLGINKKHIVSIFESLEKKETTNYWLSLYAADICIKSEQKDSAVERLNRVLKQSEDKQLNAKIYHQLALLAYEKQDYPNMIQHLENGYALNAECTQINNSLAYYWATKGKNIEKADYFFSKINSAEQQYPYCKDTQALILYKQKKYKKAQVILEELVEHNNPTMLLHLAKTHYKLNDKEKARTTCLKATEYTTEEHEKKQLQKLQLLLASND